MSTLHYHALVGQVVTDAQLNIVTPPVDGVVAWPLEPQADCLTHRPVWIEGGRWTDGRSASPNLGPGRYLVLRAPTAQIGDHVESADMLASLPVCTALLDGHGFVAQSHLLEDAVTIAWTFTGYDVAETSLDSLWRELAKPVTVLHLPAA